MSTERPAKRVRGNTPQSPAEDGARADDDALAGSDTKATSSDSALDPLSLPARLSFRQFVQATQARGGLAHDTDAAWQQAYHDYRGAHRRAQLWSFFLSHRDAAWFHEKYDPAPEYEELREKRRHVGLGSAAQWIEELDGGQLDGVCYDVTTDRTGTQPLYAVTNRRGVVEHFDNEALPVPPDPDHTLLVRAWPGDLARSALEAHLGTFPGFKYVAMLEPLAQRHWQRSGLVVFEPGTDMRAALAALDGHRFGAFQLHLARVDRPARGRLWLAPAQTQSPARIEQDAGQAMHLATRFGADDALLRAVERRLVHLGHDLHDSDEARRHAAVCTLLTQRKKQLDWLLDLLRTVYHCDYYLGVRCDCAEELVRRSTFHVRRAPSDDDEHGAAWCKHLDEKIALLLDPTHIPAALGGVDLDAYVAFSHSETAHVAERYVAQLAPEKFQCRMLSPSGACAKLFKTRAHVLKHLRTKHAAALTDAGAGRFVYVRDPLTQAAYWHRYLADPGRVMPPAHEPAERVAPSERRGTDVAPPVAPPTHYRDLDAGTAGAPLELPY
ncbi:hypothetical protein GLX27_003193 [Malassezia furfur]|uniref:C2H2-type domain-containing protein n=1 Tax=Malassezia furfur TaxID=55194 RepID=A0ABY8ESK2_MALFU|nr:hypothetical protein GLX27_003193 [Malassezia furfur]